MKPTKDSMRRVQEIFANKNASTSVAHDLALAIDAAVEDAVRGMYQIVGRRGPGYCVILSESFRPTCGGWIKKSRAKTERDGLVAAVQAIRDKGTNND